MHQSLKDYLAPRGALTVGLPLKLRVLPCPPQPLPQFACIEIPYWNYDATPSGHSRYRYVADTRTALQRAVGAKPLRYVQPKGSAQYVYAPPLMDITWAAMLAKPPPQAPLMITEGEIKAAVATAAGLPTLALGGVWSFRAPGTQDLIPDLDAIDYTDRSVHIVFDSDAVHNPDVAKAENTLAHLLTMRGAQCSVVRLPPAANGAKQGLDDFIAAHGADALLPLIQQAASYKVYRPLHLLNERYVFIESPPLIWDAAVGAAVPANGFLLATRNLRVYPPATGAGRPAINGKPAGELWLDWPGRRQAQRMDFIPGADRYVNGVFNKWAGWPLTPQDGDIQPFVQLVDYLFASAPAHKQWFMQWLAWPLQHPGAKLNTAVVLRSTAQGVGKSLLCKVLRYLYGYREDHQECIDYSTSVTESALHDERRTWLQDKLLVIGEEVTGNKRKEYSDELKSLITSRTTTVNPKFIASYETRVCANFIFNTNKAVGIYLDGDDRRYFVHDIAQPRAPAALYAAVDAWMRHTGPAHLFAHLLQLPLAEFSPQAAAPVSAAKQEMIFNSMDDMQAWCHELLASPAARLPPQYRQRALFKTGELLELFLQQNPSYTRPSVQRMSALLVECGAVRVNGGQPINVGKDVVRLIAVAQLKHWRAATVRQAAEEWLSYAAPRHLRQVK